MGGGMGGGGMAGGMGTFNQPMHQPMMQQPNSTMSGNSSSLFTSPPSNFMSSPLPADDPFGMPPMAAPAPAPDPFGAVNPFVR
mmetsp:Transcript_28414/g.86862  ORF Transcript_28414/g.86862 Transcript_28414/m.86862 type:complete len:83 (+) Transcript_28414:3-251(+)